MYQASFNPQQDDVLQCQFILRCFQVSSNVPAGANILCEYFQNSQSGRGSDDQSPHHSPWSPPFLSIYNIFRCTIYFIISERGSFVCCMLLNTILQMQCGHIMYYCKVPFVKNIFFQINTSHSLGQEVKCFLITTRRMNPLFSWLILLVLSVPCIRETKTDLDRFSLLILFNCYIIRNLQHDNYFYDEIITLKQLPTRCPLISTLQR